jgi:lipid-A-disaccharide synthase
MRKVFVVAGEASGELRFRYPQVEIMGVGGPDMLANGLPQSLFPMQQLSVMGIAEVVPAIPRILYRLQQTVAAVEKMQPDMVITIDSPDFTYRVHKAIRKNGRIKTRHVHMVAPSVWAWRPGRANKWAGVIDQLLCLLPFEPPYFENTGLRADFVGHPVTERLHPLPQGNDVLARLGIRGGPIVGLFFGSRGGELRRMGPTIVQAAQLLAIEFPGLNFIIPTLPWIERDVRDLCAKIPANCHFLTDYGDKYMAMAACDAAIAVSGTIGLELAMLEVPHLITYRLNWLSWQIARRMVQVRYAHLVNILQGAPIVPEYLQQDCQPAVLASAMIELLRDPRRQDEQRNAFRAVRNQLAPPQGFNAGSAAVMAIQAAEAGGSRLKQS